VCKSNNKCIKSGTRPVLLRAINNSNLGPYKQVHEVHFKVSLKRGNKADNEKGNGKSSIGACTNILLDQNLCGWTSQGGNSVYVISFGNTIIIYIKHLICIFVVDMTLPML